MKSPDTFILKADTRATIAASVVGTLAVNGLLAATDRTPNIVVCEPPKTHTLTSQVTEPTQMWYGRRYDQDPMAGVIREHNGTGNVVARFQALQSEGWRVNRMANQGRASSDNTGTGPGGQPDGNFQTGSADNLRLADTREKAVTPRLAAEFSSQGITTPPIESALPVEDSLTDSELTAMNDLAAQNGYDSATQMENIYDGIVPGKVKDAVRGFLDEQFGNERRVDTTFYLSRDVTTQDCTEVPVGVPVGIPIFNALPVTDFVSATYTVMQPGFQEPKVLKEQQVMNVGYNIQEPREQNFGKNKQTNLRHRGRLARSYGGDQGSRQKGRRSH